MLGIVFGGKKMYKPICLSVTKCIVCYRHILICINSIYLKDSVKERPLNISVMWKTYLWDITERYPGKSPHKLSELGIKGLTEACIFCWVSYE